MPAGAAATSFFIIYLYKRSRRPSRLPLPDSTVLTDAPSRRAGHENRSIVKAVVESPGRRAIPPHALSRGASLSCACGSSLQRSFPPQFLQSNAQKPLAFLFLSCYNIACSKSSIWGVSTVGRTSLPYFIPKTVRVGQAVNGESAQNLPRKFGALAQLVARNVRIVEVRGSNPLRSTTVRLKTNVFRRFFYVNDQNRARSDPKSRKKEGAPPQNSAIFLILGIAVLR